jgi:hypothetical protein
MTSSSIFLNDNPYFFSPVSDRPFYYLNDERKKNPRESFENFSFNFMTNSIFSYNTYVHQNTKHFLLNKIRTQFSLTFSMLPNIIRNLRFELCKLNKILRCHFTSLTKLIPKTCVAIYFPNNIKRQSHTTTIY